MTSKVEKILSYVFVDLGMTGRSELGWHINVRYLIPTYGHITARQFADWVMLSDDTNPNAYTEGELSIHSKIVAKFTEIFEGDVADCAQFHEDRD